MIEGPRDRRQCGGPVAETDRADLVRVRTELARHTNDESTRYLPTRLLAAVAVTAALWTRLPHAPLLGWFAAAVLDSVRGYFAGLHQQAHLRANPADRRWVWRDAPNWMSFGGVYGVLPVLAYLWGSTVTFVIALLLAFGIAAIVAASGVVFRVLFYCSVLPLLLPAIVVGFSGSSDLRMLGLLTTVYLVVLGIGHERTAEALVGWNLLRATNERLSVELAAERDLVHSVNDRLRHANERLAHEAGHDALTGVANRGRLLTEVAHALDRSLRFGTGIAILYIDLDHFKPVNDRWGHAVGDQLLAAAAERMRSVIGPEHLVARVGGDEFVVLLRDLSTPRTAGIVADQLHDAVTAPYVLRETVVSVGASIGTAVSSPGSTTERLLSAADAALYVAKAGGRNRVKDGSDQSLRWTADAGHAV